ncbi:MAG: hypothetical protein K0Q91_1452 [Fibrobacteria bacterium]|jgi:hypothetical protein|nr:hypothetical protein [Fibrobacteria bacterium]
MHGTLAYAKIAAVLSVLYAGVNLYPLWARFEDVRNKAVQFAVVAAGAAGSGRLRAVRALFYLAAPLAYLWTLMGAGLPVPFLALAGAKFWFSALLGLHTEQRLLRGEEYRTRDHAWARGDALANVCLAVAAICLVFKRWY